MASDQKEKHDDELTNTNGTFPLGFVNILVLNVRDHLKYVHLITKNLL